MCFDQGLNRTDDSAIHVFMPQSELLWLTSIDYKAVLGMKRFFLLITGNAAVQRLPCNPARLPRIGAVSIGRLSAGGSCPDMFALSRCEHGSALHIFNQSLSFVMKE
jgi:hypothetical protein